MKKLICILSLLSVAFGLKAQRPIEVLLVGTQHQFTDSLKHLQDFGTIRKRLSTFAPDIICIESIPTSDAASLKEVRSGQLKTAGRLREEKNIDRYNIEDQISQLVERLESNPNDLIVRSKLANLFYANHDFWNAYYHYNRLTISIEGAPEKSLNGLQKTFALDSMHARITNNQKNGEYANIVFPLADDLGIIRLQNIDYRADEEEFLGRLKKAAISTIFNLKFFKLKKMMKEMQSEMQAAEHAGRLMDHINSKQQQEFYLDLVDNADRFKKSKNVETAVTLWEFRNQVMAERILKSALDQKASRVLVTFGAFHVPFVKRYLEKVPGVKVTTYDQFMSNQSFNQIAKNDGVNH